MVHYKHKTEESNYFFCCGRDIPRLVKEAKAEATEILEDLATVCQTTKPLCIEIYVAEQPLFFSIGARLLWDGIDVIRDESVCALIFADLRRMIINRTIRARKEVDNQ